MFYNLKLVVNCHGMACSPCFQSFVVCWQAIRDLVWEVVSSLNCHGARVRFSVSQSTLSQLVQNYCDTGGFERFLGSFQNAASKVGYIDSVVDPSAISCQPNDWPAKVHVWCSCNKQVNLPISQSLLLGLMEEIFSSLNVHCAQVYYGEDVISAEELVLHYCVKGGLKRFFSEAALSGKFHVST
jgi:hypothetical protein